ncbi:SpoIIE family protein phosphatase [Nocardioides marmotae]|uniref:SpoIIE family protein phosphatase n=1 Tax=Nocardioides marmotae TaxID=2663857 RepID=A0A6I3JEA4_9ACTN|nr:SpoIIE family protein phosphatase [Nocardioides marmotae]MCR6032759.1 SpoIIE family protein phosphatase [Gordonia jinghuaiqii]MBC9735251.1 SpoIIE family protein phosphatase [Nocardioides marmotae]MTB86351.1 SpoIIE family protein phosphatase [Nocardioides marmotae]MTB96409.1 SpoIIE family protein phosphatase [Nocardioides marmotae]QKE02063.1 SpoIIE family protein phosphatase [Nocardioides marmotae]
MPSTPGGSASPAPGEGTARLRWELAVIAGGVGAFDWDLVTGELVWDDRVLAIFGLDPETFAGTIESFDAAIHPEDRARVQAAQAEAIESCGAYAAEYRVVRPDGEIRWVVARGRAVAPAEGRPAVRLLGIAFDNTAVAEGEARVQRVLDAMPTAFFHLDHEWRFTYANRAAHELLGGVSRTLVGAVLWELFPAALGTDFERYYRAAVATGEPVAFDAYYPPPLDTWSEVRAWPTPDGLSVYFNDVTDRHAAQQLLARESQRSALLAAASEALTSSLDPEIGVGLLAQVLVPEMADWCLVTLVTDETRGGWRERVRDVGRWHRDAAGRPLLDRYAELRIASLSDDSFLARALVSEEPVLVPADAASAIEQVLAPGEARTLVRALEPASALVVPLRGRGRTVGLVSLFRGSERPTFGADDIALVSEMTARAGVHVDNARLYAEQRDLAAALQHSMLTPPLAAESLEVVVRYEAASEAAQVGGDWYDAFRQRDGATVVVIGDVVGHDVVAASAMAQIRSVLRGIAVHTSDGPAAVLRGVDEAIEVLDLGTTATAAIVRFEPGSEAGTTRVRWANAGHPPPVVVDETGEVRFLVDVEPGLLLGLQPEVDRRESVVELRRGSMLLLFTDGLVERRDQPLDDGLALLAKRLTGLFHEGRGLESFGDELLRRMLPARREDDVALVAVHLR